MTPLTGIVVEYLVVGSTSALWILALADRFGGVPAELPSVLVVLFVPVLYVLGMLSDRLGRYLIEDEKRRLEKEIHRKYGRAVSSQAIHARLVVSEPGLAVQLEARRTRDRISRGVLANVPLGTLASAICFARGVGQALLIAYAGVALYLAVLSVWARFQTLSAKYETQCDRLLRSLPRRRADGSIG